jgi:hypothetical protein
VAIMQIQDRWAKERKLRSPHGYIRMEGDAGFPFPTGPGWQNNWRRSRMSLPARTDIRLDPAFRRVVRSTGASCSTSPLDTGV